MRSSFSAFRTSELAIARPRLPADEDLLPVDDERRPQGVRDPPGDIDGRPPHRRLEQDGELVAAESGDRVAGPDRLPQPLGHLDEQEVAGRVTEKVVDLLEAVEVEEEDRDAVATDGVERVLDAVAEQRAVRERRQRVVEGGVDELVLEHLPFAHVAGVEHDAAHVRVLEQVRHRHLGLADATRRVADRGARARGSPYGLGGDLAHRSIELPRALLVEQHRDRVPGDRSSTGKPNTRSTDSDW